MQTRVSLFVLVFVSVSQLTSVLDANPIPEASIDQLSAESTTASSTSNSPDSLHEHTTVVPRRYESSSAVYLIKPPIVQTNSEKPSSRFSVVSELIDKYRGVLAESTVVREETELIRNTPYIKNFPKVEDAVNEVHMYAEGINENTSRILEMFQGFDNKYDSKITGFETIYFQEMIRYYSKIFTLHAADVRIHKENFDKCIQICETNGVNNEFIYHHLQEFVDEMIIDLQKKLDKFINFFTMDAKEHSHEQNANNLGKQPIIISNPSSISINSDGTTTFVTSPESESF